MSNLVQNMLRRFRRDEAGTTMVEFAVCISLFLLILFAVLDFGRLGYNWVMAEKAMQRAVRIAAVRPPICTGVPSFHTRANPNDSTFPSGTDCRSAPNLCLASPTVECTLATPDPSNAEAQAAATEIWTSIQTLLPDNASEANVLIRYETDLQLGFLGGPYVPVMTAELIGPNDADNSGGPDNCGGGTGLDRNYCFSFLTPLSALAGAAGAASTAGVPADGGIIPFPDVSVTLPGEDMNLGSRG